MKRYLKPADEDKKSRSGDMFRSAKNILLCMRWLVDIEEAAEMDAVGSYPKGLDTGKESNTFDAHFAKQQHVKLTLAGAKNLYGYIGTPRWTANMAFLKSRSLK